MNNKLYEAIEALANSEEGQKISDALDRRLSGEDPDACGVDLHHPLEQNVLRELYNMANERGEKEAADFVKQFLD